MGGNPWQRLGGLAGILFVVLFVANFVTPSTPDLDDPTSGLARQIAGDRTGHMLSVYLDGLAMLTFLAFLAALSSLLRRAEPDPASAGASHLALLGGSLLAAIVLVADGVYLTLVTAADEGREPVAIRALLELDSTLFVPAGFALAALYGGIALSALPTRSLPAWLGWSAAAFAVLFLVALLGVFSQDNEGGPLGILYFVVLLLQFLWVLAASVVLLRSGARPAFSRHATTA